MEQEKGGYHLPVCMENKDLLLVRGLLVECDLLGRHGRLKGIYVAVVVLIDCLAIKFRSLEYVSYQ